MDKRKLFVNLEVVVMVFTFAFFVFSGNHGIGITGNVIYAYEAGYDVGIGLDNEIYNISLVELEDYADNSLDNMKLKINGIITPIINFGEIYEDPSGLIILGPNSAQENFSGEISVWKRKNMSVGDMVITSINGAEHDIIIASIEDGLASWTDNGEVISTIASSGQVGTSAERNWSLTGFKQKVYTGAPSDYLVFEYGYRISLNLTHIVNPENCTPRWTALNQTFTNEDKEVTYYNDANNCRITTNRPSNETFYMDTNGDGRIGGESDIKGTGVIIKLRINNADFNNATNYSNIGFKKVELRDNNKSLIKFDWNFSNPLNLKEIEIEKQKTIGNLSYIVIRGLEIEKTIYLDKSNPDSNSVCLIDNPNAEFEDLTEGCNSSSEILLNCPGNTSKYSCNITDGKFKITGLSSSVVSEFLAIVQGSIFCVPDTCFNLGWTCGTGIETSCDTTINCGSCDSGFTCENNNCVEDCISDWQCEDWDPKRCPKDESQSRTCNDLNSCDSENNQKIETQQCEYKYSKVAFIIISSILLIIAIGIIVAIFLIIKNNK